MLLLYVYSLRKTLPLYIYFVALTQRAHNFGLLHIEFFYSIHGLFHNKNPYLYRAIKKVFWALKINKTNIIEFVPQQSLT